ncbi:O-acyltransferase like protein isoform X1 [Nilaparvata lugens]|uniref:O-acyltransferase like protein isoform X1 n=1 Tax=Nilaparvata lugens TaxID=108931 RepID=UPI00193D6630|nr:O-acyltransferase like protein isoform X1 [Nilaparvata lugens]
MEDSGHRVPVSFSLVQWGVCVPSSCGATDIESALRSNVATHAHASGVEVRVEDKMCQARVDPLPAPKYGMRIALLVFGILISSCIAATLLDSDNYRARRPNSALMCFSLKKNWKKLTDTETSNAEDIDCLNGVRFMSALALLFSHKQMGLMFLPYINRTDLAEITGMAWSTIGRTAIIHTDAFIFMSGLLTARSFLNELSRKGKLDVKSRLISRIFRLSPNLMAVILFATWIFPNINWGPLWPQVVTTHSQLCRKYFWRNMLYIHNFFPFEKMCLTHTHQLGMDMQLFIASPLLVYCMWRWPKRSVLGLLTAASLSTMFRYNATIEHNLSPIVHYGVSIAQLMRTADLSYIRPTHRATVYIMGIFFAYYLHLRRNQPPLIMSKMTVAFGWLFGLTLGLVVLIGPYNTALLGYVYDPVEAAIYSAFSPILWCTFISWGVMASHYGYGGWFGKFLSWKYFKVFTRLAYAIYLTQFPVFFYNVGTTKAALYYSSLDLFNFSEFGVIVFLSVALTLLVDLPFQNLRRVLQSRKAANTKENLVEKCDSSEAVFSKNTGNATNDNEAAINRDSDLRRRQGSIRDIGTNL